MLRGRRVGSAESPPGRDRARDAKDRQPAGAARRGIDSGLVDWPGSVAFQFVSKFSDKTMNEKSSLVSLTSD